MSTANKPTARSWCFTHNNYTDADVQMYKDWEKNYMVLGYEVAESGTKHIQGFITFSRAYRLKQLTKLSPRAHWEQAKASDAANYCMKDGEYEVEDNRSQGKRTDLESACLLLQREGLDSLKKQLPYIFVKYPRGFSELVVQTK